MRKKLFMAILLATASFIILPGCANTTNDDANSETKTTESPAPVISLDDQLGYKRIIGSFKDQTKIYEFKEDGSGSIQDLPLNPDGPSAPISFAQNKDVIFISAYALDDAEGYIYTYDGTNLTLNSASGEKIELKKVQ